MQRVSRSLVSVVCLLTSIAQAAPGSEAANTTVRAVDNDVRAEARWRFDRGLQLYNQGEYRGALAEFQRAYELTRHAQVQLNLALVHAKLDHSAEVVRLLTPLLDDDAPSIEPKQRELAVDVLTNHRQRLGTLEVSANVDEAVIQIDNVEVAKTPSPPIPVGAGLHVVSLQAPDYEPRRFAVIVPSQSVKKLQVELRPLQEILAHLRVSTQVPDVQVFAGDELVGTTPFDASVAFRPGVHQLRFVRQGYITEQRRVVLHPGSSGELNVELALDPMAPTVGVLSVNVSEPQAVVWVNGAPRLDFATGMRLPLGKHWLRVQRSGYHELQREVVLDPSGSMVDIQLFPTADTLADYVESATSQRRWAYVTVAAGALVAAGSGAFVIWNRSREADAEADFERELELARGTESGMCTNPECERAVRSTGDQLKRISDRELWGWLGVGVGAAAMGAGVVLRLIADDPDKFRANSDTLVSNLDVEFSPIGATFRGRF